jgi:protein tyrosine/serine phosphatase
MLYRSGDFVPDGVQSIVDLGVKTVVCVRWGVRKGERDSCRVHGIAFHAFQMSPKRAPDPAAVDSILSILRNAKAPVLVHCTAGDHRTGTICALYRIRVQGWEQKAAWAEQEFFGFGPPERHPELFKFVYGDGAGLK